MLTERSFPETHLFLLLLLDSTVLSLSLSRVWVSVRRRKAKGEGKDDGEDARESERGKEKKGGMGGGLLYTWIDGRREEITLYYPIQSLLDMWH